MTDINFLALQKISLQRESILTISVYLHKGFVRNSKGVFTVSNSDLVQSSDTDLCLCACVTLSDSWSSWLVQLLANSAWTVLLLTIIGNIAISCCTQ